MFSTMLLVKNLNRRCLDYNFEVAEREEADLKIELTMQSDTKTRRSFQFKLVVSSSVLWY